MIPLWDHYQKGECLILEFCKKNIRKAKKNEVSANWQILTGL
jgi:hypothetical protein